MPCARDNSEHSCSMHKTSCIDFPDINTQLTNLPTFLLSDIEMFKTFSSNSGATSLLFTTVMCTTAVEDKGIFPWSVAVTINRCFFIECTFLVAFISPVTALILHNWSTLPESKINWSNIFSIFRPQKNFLLDILEQCVQTRNGDACAAGTMCFKISYIDRSKQLLRRISSTEPRTRAIQAIVPHMPRLTIM